MRFVELQVSYALRKSVEDDDLGRDWIYWNEDRKMWAPLWNATLIPNEKAAEAYAHMLSTSEAQVSVVKVFHP